MDVSMEEASPAGSSRSNRLSVLMKPTRLSAINAKKYRKKTLVYAFKSKDAINCLKSWGDSQGKKGDWVIINNPTGDSEGEDIYTCDNEVFMKTYEPVLQQPHVFRKTGQIWAAHMGKPFAIVTMEGIGRGNAGDWLAQNSLDCFNEQWSISAEVFEKTYELATDENKQP